MYAYITSVMQSLLNPAKCRFRAKIAAKTTISMEYWGIRGYIYILSKYQCHAINLHWRTRKYRKALINTLRPRQNGRHFPDDILKCIFLNKKVSISTKISLKFVPKGPVNNSPASVQAMTLYDPMIITLLTHICATRSQWVKCNRW